MRSGKPPATENATAAFVRLKRIVAADGLAGESAYAASSSAGPKNS
ncbi:hypothetical protein ILFOPFJJ_03795 [Ensifer psoraleae]|nr:hypothetical protein [Sinorhizobium psoraleae]